MSSQCPTHPLSALIAGSACAKPDTESRPAGTLPQPNTTASCTSSGAPLIALPIDQARRLKWQRFRRQAGIPPDAPFQGDPLEELWQELCDALNYCDAMEPTEAVRAIRAHLVAAAIAAKGLWRARRPLTAPL
jgi:hypothetical protein